jgi:hypothetical protein
MQFLNGSGLYATYTQDQVYIACFRERNCICKDCEKASGYTRRPLLLYICFLIISIQLSLNYTSLPGRDRFGGCGVAAAVAHEFLGYASSLYRFHI